MKVSIIVPIYNTESYLEECIDSICGQNYKEIEILLVDDGSTDRSGDICDAYAQKDARIKVIHQKNKGLVCARVCGIKASSGQYITFVDSDDRLEHNLVKKILDKMKTPVDLISFGCQTDEGYLAGNAGAEGLYTKNELEYIKSVAIYNETKHKPEVFQSACTKWFRAELLKEHVKYFDIDTCKMTIGEDAYLTYTFLYEKVNSLYLMEEYGYYYRTSNSNSMCKNKSFTVYEAISIFYENIRHKLDRFEELWNINRQLHFYVNLLINNANQQFFGISNRSYYFLPNSFKYITGNVAIYGAGNVGRDYYEQIQREKSCNIVAWFDKKVNSVGQNLVSKYSNKKINEDTQLIIAIENEQVAEQVKKELIQSGVREEKIFWDKPESHPETVKLLFWE